jgi:SAM-dependent MidA family methyltransferase
VSNLFSACVAQQCAEVLGTTGGSILEFGAGTGRMAATILESLAAAGTLPEQYAILEVSADLRERQQERIARLPPALSERVVWLDSLPPTPLRGVMLANEVLDALPCDRFAIRNESIQALGVRVSENGTFVELAQPAGDALADAVNELPALPEGYQSEICLRVAPWIAGVAPCLEQGVILLFDYGLPRAHYYHPQRDRGTLRCHFKQLVHDDPFVNVGIQDITAWVDFTRVADAALAAGLDVPGFATQAAFLLANGIDRLIEDAADAVERARRASEARQLLMPAEMGEAFKVMALGRGVDPPLRGFSIQDLRDSL